MTQQAHRFRFFVEVEGAPGARVELTAFDAHHARVLHGSRKGEPVEVVDAAGQLWVGEFDGPSGAVLLGDAPESVEHESTIVVFAFATVGGRFDELVDGAVQAGATRIVPVVRSAKDRTKVDARNERLMRISLTAAKQAKRAGWPLVTEAVDPSALLEVPAGIVVDPDAAEGLDAVVRAGTPGSPIRLLVGSSDGFPADLVEQLVAAGWSRARLGPTILRSELAAAVAVAIAAMHATHA